MTIFLMFKDKYQRLSANKYKMSFQPVPPVPIFRGYFGACPESKSSRIPDIASLYQFITAYHVFQSQYDCSTINF